MILITTAQIQQHVPLSAIITATEQAFVALGRGDSALFPVISGLGFDPTHSLAVKSGRDGSTGLLGVKAASYKSSNRTRGLAAHTSNTMLIDDATAAVIAVVEADYLNGMRTAASNAVATHRLARDDAHILVVIGLGAQAVFEVEAMLAIRQIDRIIAVRRSVESDRRFAAAVAERTGRAVEFAEAEAAVRQADIIVTVTPSSHPLLDQDWVRPGTHVSAMGADDVGKQELPVALVAAATLVVDHPEQAAEIGEAQHVVARRLLSMETLRRNSLGALLDGKTMGRSTADEITIFDSSGTAIQDIAAAATALKLVQAAEADA